MRMKSPHAKSTNSFIPGPNKLSGIDEAGGIGNKTKLKSLSANQNSRNKRISRSRSAIG